MQQFCVEPLSDLSLTFYGWSPGPQEKKRSRSREKREKKRSRCDRSVIEADVCVSHAMAMACGFA